MPARERFPRARLPFPAVLDTDSSGNFLKIPGNQVKATGLPGDTGLMSLALVEAGAGAGGSAGAGKCATLKSHICVRKVSAGRNGCGGRRRAGGRAGG